MGCLIYLTTLLLIGRIVDTRGLPLELTQFQSGDDVSLVCSATNTTINMSITYWYIDDKRVLMLVLAGHVCTIQPPNATGDTPAYRYDLYTSTDVSVSCGFLQHNMTLTTTKYVVAGTVWRCEDQQYRVSNNLTVGFQGTTYEASSQLTDSATTLAKLTTIKITTDPNIANQDDTMYIAAGAGGGILILILIVISVFVLRRRNGKVTQDVPLAEIGAPQYDTLAHSGNRDPCYSEIKLEAPRQSNIHANDVYYNTVSKNADYENPPMRTYFSENHCFEWSDQQVT